VSRATAALTTKSGHNRTRGHQIALRYVITIGLILAVTFTALNTYKQQGQRPGDPDDPKQ
jgi:hypothetical protein